jgi:multidrug efflux system membrane fusion protein
MLENPLDQLSEYAMHSRPWSVRLSFVAATALLALASCDNAPPPAAAPGPPPVTVAKPVVKNIVEMDEFTGRFDAPETVELRARVAGYLQSVNFTEGGLVKQGDLLYVIDKRPYQAALALAEANVTGATTRLEYGRIEYERAERLSRTGAGAERAVDERRQQFQSAQAELAAARASLEQSRLDLGFTEIRAPIGGRISRTLVTPGNLIAANDTLLTTIVTVDPIYFYFDVDERSALAYARNLDRAGRLASRADGYEVELALADERTPSRKGRVNFTENRFDQATGTLRARAVFENTDLLLTPGMFGTISIPGTPSYRAVMIPDEAIGADLDRRFVYVVAEDGTVSQKQIRPGSRHDGYRVVREGLTGEETIIIAGVQRARFAGKVTPQPTTLPPTR